MEITAEIASRVLEIVDCGLCPGIGQPIPGQMCIEAAICHALGLPHGDNAGSCVSQAPRLVSMRLNEGFKGTNEERANALRRLAIAQLGTAGTLDEQLFANKMSQMAITKLLPKVLRSAAALFQEPQQSQLLAAADRCQTDGSAAAATAAAMAAESVDPRVATARQLTKSHWQSESNARSSSGTAASVARWAFSAAATARCGSAEEAAGDAAIAATVTTDELLSEFAEDVVQILIEMKTPGSAYLPPLRSC